MKNSINGNIITAIKRSVSRNEIARVTVANKAEQKESLEDVSRLDIVEECDYSVENDGSYDVYGTTVGGDEFRIRIGVLA